MGNIFSWLVFLKTDSSNLSQVKTRCQGHWRLIISYYLLNSLKCYINEGGKWLFLKILNSMKSVKKLKVVGSELCRHWAYRLETVAILDVPYAAQGKISIDLDFLKKKATGYGYARNAKGVMAFHLFKKYWAAILRKLLKRLQR